MELSIKKVESEDGRWGTLVLAGAVDLVTRGDLVASGRAVLESGRALALDMDEVFFIDSTGIGALVELHNLARSYGMPLEVPFRSDRVERILRVTGLAEAWIAA